MAAKNTSTLDSRNQIASWLRRAIKTERDRKVGIEIERMGMWPDGKALHYRRQVAADGTQRPGAEDLLKALHEKYGWPLVENEKGQPLGMKSPYGKVSLEPGSQLELSSDPHPDLRRARIEIRKFEAQVEEITQTWGMKWPGIGVNPTQTVSDIDVIPSARYHIMTEYLPKRGKLATSMMRLATSIQVNLDYTSEAEGIAMLRAGLAGAPLSYALFGNSPFSEGNTTNVLSFRNLIWRDTDPDRTGLLPQAFDPDFNFDTYADLVWHRPLMFAQDGSGNYIPGNGKSLADIAAGKLPGATITDDNQMNAIREMFFETRLKPGYVEVRCLDALMPAQRYAAVAFWMGILYDRTARDLMLQTFGTLTPEARTALMQSAASEGLRAKADHRTLSEIAREFLPAIRSGLKSRGFDEELFLAPMEQTLREGESPADKLLKNFNGPWQRQWSKVVEQTSLPEPYDAP